MLRKNSPRAAKWLALPLFAVLAALLYTSFSVQTTTATATPTISKAEQTKIETKLKKKISPSTFPDEAEALFRAKRLSAGANFDVTARYEGAFQQIKAMPRFSTRDGHEMVPLKDAGEPFTIPTNAGEAKARGTWEPLGPGNHGGRSRVLVFDPRDPQIMYAGGVSGGLWKTTNGGRKWRPLTDLLPNIAVNALAMDPVNPNILYIGTGEGYFREVARGTALPLRGAGIFKSEDGGNSWQRLASTRGEDFYWVNDLVISPHNRSRIYAATRTGVWISRNAGASWRRVHNPDRLGGCLDLAIRSDKPTDFVFATCGTFAQGAVYRHEEAEQGTPWRRVLTERDMGRISLALAPSNEDIMYALSARFGHPVFDAGLHAVHRSDDGGDTWTATVRSDDPDKANTLLLTIAVNAVTEECGFGGFNSFISLGWYANVIAVEPNNPDVVYVGGVDLFRSDDGGRNFGPLSHWWTASPRTNAHGDMHAIVFHPRYNGTSNQRLYLGTDGGIYFTNKALAERGTGVDALCNPSLNRARWNSLNNNYGVTQFYHGAVFPNGRQYLGGTQDNGTLLGNDNKGIDGWDLVFCGDGGYAAVDPSDPRTVYASFQFQSLAKSTDGGRNFQFAFNGINDETIPSVLFITPYIIDPNDPQRLWTGGTWIWRTNNGMDLWERASVALAGRTSALAVAPSNSERVAVATENGFIYRNADASNADRNTAWERSRPRGGFATWLAFDPFDENVLYATYAEFGGRHVWKSTDAGVTWESIDGRGAGRLPDIPVHSIVVDPADTQRLYIGTDLGVMVTLDGGRRWQVENTGFAAAVTETLVLHETPAGQRFLFAFTHGRGAWRLALDPAPSAPGGGSGSVGDDDGGDDVAATCAFAPGHRRYCKECGPCAEGMGGCRRDRHCEGGLVCLEGVGDAYGFEATTNVCVAP